jgi:REP element-mobilizing transposase RayT
VSALTIDTKIEERQSRPLPRQWRIQFRGAIYHVLNRCDRCEPIFHDDADRQRFLETLGQACAKTQWFILAYCLMGNHFHLVVETPLGNLVDGMKWLLGTYSSPHPGNRRAMESFAARMVSGGRSVSAGMAGSGAGPSGAQSLRSGAAGNG